MTISDFVNSWLVGFSMMRKSGSDLSFRIRRRRTRFGTSTSSSFRGWEALICIPRGKDLFIEPLGEWWLGSTRMTSIMEFDATKGMFYSFGHPALIGRHAPFPVTHQAAERWLHHMQQALDSTMSIDPNSKVKMMNFFRHISTHTMSSFVYVFY
ncbi:hypothetical protein ZIOFF_037149 [Zingiber officinale]|uniref:Uncharacterized protein n=1 Tax=Zingiber officinale TaxID=94328 RepID=A0A8J5GCW0_ZINOF|nr:hypothetical protein ZIOFF_037149 [Zingiber officinale]